MKKLHFRRKKKTGRGRLHLIYIYTGPTPFIFLILAPPSQALVLQERQYVRLSHVLPEDENTEY